MSNFRINPDSVRSQSAVISQCSSEMKIFANEIESIGNELTGSLEIVKPAITAVAAASNNHATKLNLTADALLEICAEYLKAEQNTLSNMGKTNGSGPAANPSESRDGVSDLYDGDGQYGGNQMNMGDRGYQVDGFKGWVNDFFDVHLFKDEEFYDFVRSHPGYENLTDEQIDEVLMGIQNSGCNWTASVNSIFAEYLGREEEFEKTFGFPMYVNGELNYTMLTADFYLSTHGKYYVGPDDISGDDALFNSIYNYYRDHPDEFKDKYGVDFYEADGTTERYSATKDFVSQEAQDMIDNRGDNDYVVYDKDQNALGCPESPNRMNRYLKDHGIDTFSYDYKEGTYSNQQIREALDSGKSVVICAEDFNLYNEDGSKYNKKPIGAHAVTVTDITPEGYYVVSSWGQKFILKPNEKAPDGSDTIYYSDIIDIYDETGDVK